MSPAALAAPLPREAQPHTPLMDRLLAVAAVPSTSDGQRTTRPLVPAQLACFLRDTQASLEDLGIQVPDAQIDPRTGRRIPFSAQDSWWGRLWECMKTAEPRDALVIFEAMARALIGYSLQECDLLMSQALTRPWRLDAISECPWFFTELRKPNADHLPALNDGATRCTSVFQVLACTHTEGGWRMEDLRPTIRALKELDIQDGPVSPGQDGCVHVAALIQTATGLAAFIEEFPEQIEMRSWKGRRPLHHAALMPQSDIVQTLLDAGAFPRPEDTHGTTPLTLAASVNNIESAMLLVSTGHYSDGDVAVASKRFYTEDKRARLRAFHKSMKSHKAVEGAGKQIRGINPLQD